MKSNTQDCFLSELMTSANMGWWEADVNSESYICSEYQDLIKMEQLVLAILIAVF